MQFELLRLSMVKRDQVRLFDRRRADGASFTREEWLRDVFGKSIQFEHRKSTFHYEPGTGTGPGEIISGRIGRRLKVVENEPPEGHLADKERESWRAASVLIDPTHHMDGQKVAVENLGIVGKPVALFESLASAINSRDEPFVLEVNAIVPEESFWNFVKENAGQVTFVQFEFVSPNMFGHADDYDVEMREMQREERVQKAKLTLESKDGLNLDTDKVKRAADYTIKGAGSIKSRTSKNKKYNSKDRAKKISIPKTELDGISTELLISHLVDRIFKA